MADVLAEKYGDEKRFQMKWRNTYGKQGYISKE